MSKISYQRNLPHIQPIGATFFVTFRLHGSINADEFRKVKEAYHQKINILKQVAVSSIEIYKEGKRFFAKFDQLLDNNHTITYLKHPKVAKVVSEQLHHFDKSLYDLLAYCIMPNHVHLVIDTSQQFSNKQFKEQHYVQLDKIMKKIKGRSAMFANRVLNRKGQFWQRESYDHYVRNQKELENIIAYIANNPVKANLVKNWEDWPYTFIKI